MNIAVCIKDVPDTTEVRMDPETNTLLRAGVESMINPFDTYALEEAVQIRERLGRGSVTVISMGPPQVERALREALSVGADEVLHLCDRAFAGADTWATSTSLAAALRGMDVRLVLFGKQAIDGDTAQVGPGVACHLGWPQVCYVSRVLEMDERRVVVERLLDGRYEAVEVDLPAVLTVVKELNEPRLPSLRGKMTSRRADVRRVTVADLGLDPATIGLAGSPTQVASISSPPARGGGERIDGATPDEVASTLLARLQACGALASVETSS